MLLAVTLTNCEIIGLIIALIIVGMVIGVFAVALLSANHPRR